jgi:hypothetical protein
LQKSEFLQLIISFFHHFDAKIEISGRKWVEKTPMYIFSTFGSKINKFWVEKSLKKTIQKSKSCRTLP